MRRLIYIFFIYLVSCNYLYGQLELSIATDKDTYDYGEPIQIICTITNPTETQVSFLHGCSDSWQAEFRFNDKDSFVWGPCFTMSQWLTFSPGGNRTYTWLIDPQKMGLPNLDGEQRIIGYFHGYDEYFAKNKDTTFISAPLFLGGELSVGYLFEKDSLVAQLKDSLEIVAMGGFDGINTRIEHWRFTGIQLDTLLNMLNNDNRIEFAEFYIFFRYESITSVQESNSIPISYTISNAYPNPFNPTTSFYVELSETQPVSIDLYNSLGEKVSTIFNGVINGGNRKSFKIDGSNLASGIYYYRIESKNYSKTKKIVLLK